MKIIKVLYNKETKFICGIIDKLKAHHIVEYYDIDYYKDKKKSFEIMTRFGTKNVPLVVFENENLDEYAAIWSEQNPDWEKEISDKLNEKE